MGTTWTAVDSASLGDMIQYSSVLSLVAHGSDVFAVTHRGIIYRSRNDGMSWTLYKNMGSDWPFDGMMFHDTTTFILHYGILRTEDDGINWTTINIGQEWIKSFVVTDDYYLA